MEFQETSMDTFRTSDGTEFDIHLWEAETTEIVFLAIHGALAHAGDYVTLAKYYLEHNITTVSYDLRGHKQKRLHANSFDEFVEDTNQFLTWVKNKYPSKPIIVVGHSFGGVITLASGIRGWKAETQIKGFVISSPYLRNAVKISPILIKLSGLFAKIMPKGKVPAEDLAPLLTHDDEIYQRHRRDEEKRLRAVEVSMKFGTIFLNSQKWIENNIEKWESPLYAVIAGDDKVANPEFSKELLSRIDNQYIKLVIHDENYHENFNELNRNEIFADILKWVKERV